MMRAVHTLRCTAFFIYDLVFSYVGGICMKKLLNWIIPVAFGLVLWFIPTPEGLTPQSWHYLPSLLLLL